VADNLAYVGSRTVGECVPLAVTAQGIALAQLQPKLAGLLNVSAALTIGPPSLAVTIQGAIAAVAALQASITGPTITLQAAAVLDLIASLQAQIALLLQFSVLFGSAGVHAYVYDGRNSGFAQQVNAVLPNGFPGAAASSGANAIVLGCTSPTTFSALREALGL
jgi:hypothetical protein